MLRNSRIFTLNLYGTVVFVLCLALVSCNDVIEKDISGETPFMIVPQANDTIPEYSHFLWEPLEGATHYRLQIFSPSFASPTFIAFDSTTSANSLFVSLERGTYEYKLTAHNNGYQSLPSGPFPFVVDTVQGSQAQINLNTPSSGSYYNGSFNGFFSWSGLSGVSSYEFSLREGTEYATGTIVHSQNSIASNSISVTNVDYTDGNYVWGVKAYLANGASTTTFTSTFRIDDTPPVTPMLVAPADNAIVSSPVTFTWSNASDTGIIQSPVTSIVQVATDEAFSSIETSETVTGTTTDIPLPSGNYYWRVYNMDAAANQGSYSTVRTLTVN